MNQPYSDLIEALKPRAKAWVAVTGLDTTAAINRARWAEAEAGRLGRLVLVEPTDPAVSLPRAGARALTIEEGVARLRAAGFEDAARLAALLELSPSAIDDASNLARAGVDAAELAKLALSGPEPGAALVPDARERFHLPSWPERVELAYRAGDLEVASHWAIGWRAANGGARATAALARVRVLEASIDEARTLVLEASREARREERDDATRFEVARAQGLTCLFDGDLGNASQFLREARDSAEKLGRDFIDQAEIYDAWVQALISEGRIDSAEHPLHEWTTKIGGRTEWLSHALIVRPMVELRIAQGDLKAAAQLIEQWLKQSRDRDPLGRASMDQLSAQVLLAGEHYEEAAYFIRRTIERFEELGRRAAPLRQLHAQALLELGRFQEAEKELRRVLAESSVGSTGITVAYDTLSACLAAQGRLDEAEALLDTCLSELREEGFLRTQLRTTVLHHKASIHIMRGDLPRAEELLRDVLRREEQSHGRGASLVAQTLIELSKTLVRLDRSTEAEPLLRRAERLSRQAGDLWARAMALSMLAGTQAAQGFQHARNTARQSLEAWKATGHEVPPAHLRDLEAIIAGAGLPPSTSLRRRR